MFWTLKKLLLWCFYAMSYIWTLSKAVSVACLVASIWVILCSELDVLNNKLKKKRNSGYSFLSHHPELSFDYLFFIDLIDLPVTYMKSISLAMWGMLWYPSLGAQPWACVFLSWDDRILAVLSLSPWSVQFFYLFWHHTPLLSSTEYWLIALWGINCSTV